MLIRSCGLHEFWARLKLHVRNAEEKCSLLKQVLFCNTRGKATEEIVSLDSPSSANKLDNELSEISMLEDAKPLLAKSTAVSYTTLKPIAVLTVVHVSEAK